MKKTFLIIGLACIGVTVSGQNIRGPWKGVLNAGNVKLNIVLHIDNDSICRLNSPDQTSEDIPGQVAYISEDSILVKVPKLLVLYGGKLHDGKLKGTFIQGISALPLTLEPGELVRNRPQTPQPPFPYKTEEVTFTNTKADATLAGTLTVPKDGAKCVLLMVTGSGAQNRDEEVFGHSPFAVIADRLARAGIATLRYDDRATGKSVGGKDPNITTKDFAEDALAGIEWLRKDGRFKKVGLLGHSEGGTIAFMLGAQKKLDFIVSLAGTSVKGDSVLLEQNKAIAGIMAKNLTIEKLRDMPAIKQSPWMMWFLDYDPQADIAKVKCPVMAIYGSKDCQVLASQNLPALRRTLPKNKYHLIKEYPDLNHLFQHCQTGMPNEYGQIEETISEEVLSEIVSWLKTIE
ncbi:MAG: dienelactone hydrolase family protein [Prevotella sp.]|nr:dienelactone hydrolase family protein [Prevotella sp.]